MKRALRNDDDDDDDGSDNNESSDNHTNGRPLGDIGQASSSAMQSTKKNLLKRQASRDSMEGGSPRKKVSFRICGIYTCGQFPTNSVPII